MPGQRWPARPAAAVAAGSGVPPTGIDVAELRTALEDSGALLDRPVPLMGTADFQSDTRC
ncbi:hypothetical protein [Nonomuraea insulae]|uniref:Uncharacterized protein n=1 Tax=Nonomuraea insulae TaxID=1616787 RepID=A0ABW1D428_9ACTN